MGPHTISDRDSRQVLDALRRLVRTLRLSAREAERRTGVSGAQLFVLHQLRDAAPLTVNQLAERTLTHQSTVSVVVTHLVERGLVARTRDEADARRAAVTLTAKGRRLLTRAPEPAQQRLVAGLTRLPLARRRTLARGLTSLAEAMGLSGETPQLLFENERTPAQRRRTPRKKVERP